MLREAVSMMAVGAELPRSDTVAEETRSVSIAPAAKELGDVRSARTVLPRSKPMPRCKDHLLAGLHVSCRLLGSSNGAAGTSLGSICKP